MSKHILIGLTGKAGAGKNAVGDYLHSEHDFECMAYADPIKNAISAILDAPREALEDREVKEKEIEWLGKSPRQLMQLLGTEWGRGLVHPDVWLLIANSRIKHLRNMANTTRIVVTDVRFENEAESIREQGGHIVHILREAPSIAAHKSEAGVRMQSGDYVIYNERDLQHLYTQAERIYVSLTGNPVGACMLKPAESHIAVLTIGNRVRISGYKGSTEYVVSDTGRIVHEYTPTDISS